MDLQQVMRDAVAPRPKVARPIVLIGAGGIAHDAHLPAYAKAGFPVAAVVDLNQEKAQALAAQFGIPKVVATIGEAVRALPKDVVFDCAVPAPALIAVLEQLPDGAAALLQKPMGETLAEAEEILAICRRKGLDRGGQLSVALCAEYDGGSGAGGDGGVGGVARHGGEG